MLFCKINPVVAIVDGKEVDSKLFKDLITILGTKNRDLVTKIWDFVTYDQTFRNNNFIEEDYDEFGEIKIDSLIKAMNRTGDFDNIFNKENIQISKNIEEFIGVRKGDEYVDFISYEAAIALATNYNTNGVLAKQYIATITTVKKNKSLVHNIKIQKKNSKLNKLWKQQLIQSGTIGTISKLLTKANIPMRVIDEAFMIENKTLSSYSTKAGDIAIVGMLGIQNISGDNYRDARLAFLRDFGSFAFCVMEGNPLYSRAIELAKSEDIQREVWKDEYDTFIKDTIEEDRAYKTAGKLVGEMLVDDYAYMRHSTATFWKRLKNKIIEIFRKVPTNDLTELRKEINKQYKEVLQEFISDSTTDINKDLDTGRPLFNTENIRKRNSLIRNIINISNKQIFMLQKLKVDISPELYSIRVKALSIGDLTYINNAKIEELTNILVSTKTDILQAETYLKEIGNKITPKYLDMVYQTQGEDAYFRELNKKLVILRKLEILYEGFNRILKEYDNITQKSGSGKSILLEDLEESIKSEFNKELNLSPKINNKRYLSEDSINRLQNIFMNYMVDEKGNKKRFNLKNLMNIYNHENTEDSVEVLANKIANEIYTQMGWPNLTRYIQDKDEGKKSTIEELQSIMDNARTIVAEETNTMIASFAEHYMGKDLGVNVKKYSKLHNTVLGSKLSGIFSALTSGSQALDTITQLMANVSKIQMKRSAQEVNEFKRELQALINTLPADQQDLKWMMELNTDPNHANYGLPTGRFLSPSDYSAYKKARTLAKIQIAKKHNIPVGAIARNISASNEFAQWHKNNNEKYSELSTDPVFTLRNNLMRNLKLSEGTIIFSLPSYDKAEEELKIWEDFFNGINVTPELVNKYKAIEEESLSKGEDLKHYLLNPNGYVRHANEIISTNWREEHNRVKNFQTLLAKYTNLINNPNLPRTEAEQKYIIENTRNTFIIPKRSIYPSEAYNKLSPKQKEILEFFRAKKWEFDKLLPAKTFKENESLLPQVKATTLELIGNGNYKTIATDFYDKNFGVFQEDELTGFRNTSGIKDIKDEQIALTDLPISYVKKIKTSELTKDIAMGMVSYAAMANRYYNMESVLHIAEVGKIFLDNNPINTKDSTTKKNNASQSNHNHIKDQYKKMLDRNYYGVSMYKNSVGTLKLSKVSKLIQKTSRFILMGLDVTLAGVNTMTGFNVVLQEAFGKQMMDPKSCIKAWKQLGIAIPNAFANIGKNVENDEFSLYRDYFDFYDDFGYGNLSNAFNRNRIVRAADPIKIAMGAHTLSNNFISSWVYLSRLHFVKVLLDGKQISLYDAFEKVIINKDDPNQTKKLKLKDNVTDLDGNKIDQKFVDDFKTSTNVLLNELTGANDILSKNSFSMTIVGSFLQFMKGWAVPAYERHWGPTRYNAAKKVVTSGMNVDVIKSLLTLLDIGAKSLVNKPSRSFWETMAPTLDSTNSEIIKIDETRRQYIKGNYRKAIMSYAEFIALSVLVRFLASTLKAREDDEEEENDYTTERDLDWTAILLYFASKGQRELGAMSPLSPLMMKQEAENIFSTSSAGGMVVESLYKLTKDVVTQDRHTKGHLILNEYGQKLVAPYDKETKTFDIDNGYYIGVDDRTPEGYRIVRDKKYKDDLKMILPGRKTWRMFIDNEAEDMLYSYLQGKYKLK